MYTEQKVILAADEFNREDLLNLVKNIGPKVFCIKIHNLYDQFGPQIIKEIKFAGANKVWVDAKLHDIPNTVRLRAETYAKAGADMVTVHASGGVEMMTAAKQGFGSGKVYAITALTSLSDEMVKTIYQSDSAAELVGRLAPLIKQAGVDGLVCSPKEITMLRANHDYDGLDLVVPGIRSVGVSIDDQQRFDTPANALKTGASLLVIGRQITKAPNALAALDALETELAELKNV